jgi:hypothetical protein
MKGHYRYCDAAVAASFWAMLALFVVAMLLVVGYGEIREPALTQFPSTVQTAAAPSPSPPAMLSPAERPLTRDGTPQS